jgi:predicted DNA-binding transcriptional regulator YafY
MDELTELLECSQPTVKRLIKTLRIEYGAPLVFNRKYGGYILDKSDGESLQLPGLWFNLSELHSLLLIQELLDQLEPGLLKADLAPFRTRIESILSVKEMPTGELRHRIKIIAVGDRVCCPLHFKVVARALMERKRLQLRYHSRGKNQSINRLVSPQRLIYYRGNWFLVVHCHTRRGLRTLALDRIQEIRPRKDIAVELEPGRLDQHFGESFGIFSGKPVKKAVLCFTPERARWIAEENWHPDQVGQWLDDGSYQLSIPYADSRELILDILKYGPDVEVLEPLSLRQEIHGRLQAALKKYQK